jgi:flavin reductase (DIM6/NTAB) family NADH-FMN oxidoreductase RutF
MSDKSQPLSAPQAIDARHFRDGLGCYPTGVTVVTTRDAHGQPRGFTANSFTSVSLDPPLISVCLAKTAHSHAVFSAAAAFAIHILSEAQKPISSLFASKVADKFEQCQWRDGHGGVPLIQDSLATFECKTWQLVDAGDHTILIGKVVGLEHSPGRPLGYCRGAYVGYQEVAAVNASGSGNAHIHALIESDAGVALLRQADGTYELPGATRLGTVAGNDGLYGVLKALGLQATLDFVFSVYEDAQGPCVIYRGRAPNVLSENSGLHHVALEHLAGLKVANDATASVLARYARERAEDSFGVYVGDAECGDVAALAH